MLKRRLMLLGGSQAFSPRQNWPTGTEPGLWWAPDSFLTTYDQDSLATTPMTAVEQVAGFAGDRSGRTVPNNGLQATAAARPPISARVNQLPSQNLSDANWAQNGVTIGGTRTIIPTAVSAFHASQPNITSLVGPWTISFKAKANGYDRIIVSPNVVSSCVGFNLTTGAKERSSGGAVTSTTITPLGGGVFQITVTGLTTDSGTLLWFMPYNGDASAVAAIPTWTGDGVSGVDVWDPQIEYGPAFTRLQWINSASSYDTAGFPVYEYEDGLDNGRGTATFAAGTLSNNMDVYIPVFRTSTAKGALCSSSVGATAAFGVFDSAGAAALATLAAAGSGSTYFVNGVAVPGGTATTQVQLNTALPVGQWCVVAIYNVDLSTWTDFKESLLSGYPVAGGIAQTIVAPAGVNRAKNLTYCGRLVGLVL